MTTTIIILILSITVLFFAGSTAYLLLLVVKTMKVHDAALRDHQSGINKIVEVIKSHDSVLRDILKMAGAEFPKEEDDPIRKVTGPAGNA